MSAPCPLLSHPDRGLACARSRQVPAGPPGSRPPVAPSSRRVQKLPFYRISFFLARKTSFYQIFCIRASFLKQGLRNMERRNNWSRATRNAPRTGDNIPRSLRVRNKMRLSSRAARFPRFRPERQQPASDPVSAWPWRAIAWLLLRRELRQAAGCRYTRPYFLRV
jgi:hypothetical protein